IDGVGDGGNGRFSVESITLHPEYNPGTLANNIAILKYKKTAPIEWYQPIGYDRQGWNDVYYTSRSLSNPRTPSFNTPSIASIGGSDDGCAAASNLYSANKDIMLCITRTTTSSVNDKCQLPYGAAWGVYQPDDIAIGALYSHSVVYGGNSLCGNQQKQFHYYLMLQPYTAWAAKVLGRGSNAGGDGSNGYIEGGKGNGGHNNDGGEIDNGEEGGEGDLGPNMPNKGGTSPSNTSGMSRSATIVVATVVPIVTLLIMVGLFFAYKWWKRRQNAISWDPKNERANLDRIRIIDELTAVAPSPAPPNVTPPSYLEHEFESIFNPVGKTQA
ncbi:hypothetical protein H4S02_004450, partial [Coemansia sp. RSA 2611]